MSEESGFISRWAERKRRVQDESQKMAAEAKEAATSEPQAADEFEGKTDDEILMELELPAPESLKLGDSVAGFMDARVPERIRHRALRAFWKTNPVLANIDGLDEYCEDYTDAVMIIENMETIYEVGKGYASQALDALESLAEDVTTDDPELTADIQVNKPNQTADQRLTRETAADVPQEKNDAEDRQHPVRQDEGLPETDAKESDVPRLGRRMQFRT